MSTLVTPGQARIPIGTATVNGQRVDVYLHPEWARFFESLTLQTVSNTVSVINGRNGVDGATVALLSSDDGGALEFIPGPTGAQGPQGDAGPAIGMLANDGGDAVEFIPGPPGPQGQPGDPGPALFLLQDNDTNDIFWPIKAG